MVGTRPGRVTENAAMATIKFGTSGWRGIIAQDFTFAGDRAVSQAIGEYLTTRPSATG